MTHTTKIRVLMVCLGNICRSPTAEAAFRRQVEQANLGARISIDSAGTADWHQGNPPDPRSMQHAARRDYDLSTQRARPVVAADFSQFDYVLAMDQQNLRDLQALCPVSQHHRLGLFLGDGVRGYREVPDPYQGGAEGFELVLDLCEAASAELLKRLRAQHPDLAHD